MTDNERKLMKSKRIFLRFTLPNEIFGKDDIGDRTSCFPIDHFVLFKFAIFNPSSLSLSRTYLLHRNQLLVKYFIGLFSSYESLNKVFRTENTLPLLTCFFKWPYRRLQSFNNKICIISNETVFQFLSNSNSCPFTPKWHVEQQRAPSTSAVIFLPRSCSSP